MQTAGGRVHPSRAVSWVCGRHWATAHLLPVITTCRVFEEFILLLFPEIPRRYHSSLNSSGANKPFITVFRLHILGDTFGWLSIFQITATTRVFNPNLWGSSPKKQLSPCRNDRVLQLQSCPPDTDMTSAQNLSIQ